MEILGLDTRALEILGALEYTNLHNKLIEYPENKIYECKEIKEILQSLPKEKQVQVLENQAYFEAVGFLPSHPLFEANLSTTYSLGCDPSRSLRKESSWLN